ncbi:hypothetical protein [Sulfoacidibacillus thermotolerans]|uniref:hypothetical protein n=1 Tax=Sulfoacidibacillus thermotolerans TaxID=1765684 RepID=UPI0015E7F335|nr:hypothetical protein [Sulfoacidibacillus thermotolerans]
MVVWIWILAPGVLLYGALAYANWANEAHWKRHMQEAQEEKKDHQKILPPPP